MNAATRESISAPGRVSRPPVRLLVVEDLEEDFRFVSMLLARAGLEELYELDWASSFEEGLARLESRTYDAALVDYGLGGSTGLDLLRAAQARGAEMPVILLTGVDNPQIDDEALRSGAADYLCKADLTTVQLERTIRYARKQAGMFAQLRRTTHLLNSVLSSLPVIAGRLDGDANIVEARGRGLRLLGIGEETLIGRNACREWPAVDAEIRRALDGGESEFTCELVHGNRRRYFDSYLRFDEVRGRGAVGFSIDVTARVSAEQERRLHAQLLHNILRNVPAVAGRLDARGRVIDMLGHGLEPYGLAPDRVRGRFLAELFPQTREAIGRALVGGSTAFALVGHNRDGDWSVDISISFDAEHGQGAIFFGRDLSERRRLERLVLNVSDAEQQRIGADLHDGLGQQLTGIACLAAALRERLATACPAEAQAASQIAQFANEATVQSRALARGLSPVQLEVHGLASALEDLAFQSQRLHGIDCAFSLRGASPAMDHLAAIHLYRITQEAIHNAVRHGSARRVRIGLFSRRSRHRLVVLDDGHGFDATTAGPSCGRGLRLMHYRANMLGGSLSVRSRQGAGVRITCDWTQLSTNEN